ncbi:hypothetical protein SODALDRAFT_108141 [Sodiomyces alkalinus F11]|uniref:Uncharacterized protein n=1 Tax=Sodiomyces alkalinus (strain CBS 110278 / VKM F-3762 / F11) TaxID=1314773 RepID=A0A3N2Q2M4_SODAK|nr:hypothetical protein SODALDRAFT_108141 [Sodiomyces alkalinus F11]ROT40928.1 hypothetical protein SODALDRAFT_108141 [Sodiomyces alkalinus F11]
MYTSCCRQIKRMIETWEPAWRRFYVLVLVLHFVLSIIYDEGENKQDCWECSATLTAVRQTRSSQSTCNNIVLTNPLGFVCTSIRCY